MILGHICFANMKENVFLFIPNLIGKYFEDLKFSQKCFSELLAPSSSAYPSMTAGI